MSIHKSSLERSVQAAFTLIELLVVISVISFLASIILVATNSASAKGRDAQRQANVAQMAKALDLYYDDHNTYPTGTFYSGWDGGNYSGSDQHCWCQSTSTAGAFEQAIVINSYLTKLPEDARPAEGSGNFLSDGQGSGYLYVSSDDGQSYVLGTSLENSAYTAPAADSVSLCRAAGNYQVSVGIVPATNCPALGYTVGGGGSSGPNYRGGLAGRTGTQASRRWAMQLGNLTTHNLSIKINNMSVSSSIPGCNPVVLTTMPGFPIAEAPGALGSINISIDFSTCPAGVSGTYTATYGIQGFYYPNIALPIETFTVSSPDGNF